MKQKFPSRSLSLLLFILLAIRFCQTAEAAAPKKLNVVLILVDDYGWTDLSCYGSKFYETPNVDKLARDGMKFTQAYAACCVCSPTRSAIMTGKYPARTHITDWIPGQMPENPKVLVPDWTKYLPLTEISIGRAFHNAGYATASIGKWHLGGEDYWPDKQGFDVNIAGTERPNPKTYFSPYDIPTLKDGPPGEYITDRLGDEVEKFIDKNKDRPFFIYFPEFAVHLPLQAKKEMIAKYKKRIHSGMAQTNAVYAAMIESMDDTVGRVRRKLKDLNLTDNTVVVLASDNGGRIPTTSNLPLRDGKGSCHEGGVRGPLIFYWPHVTKPGSVCDTPVISMDLYPTLLEIAGEKEAAKKGIDGVSLVPLLRQTGTLQRDELFWHYPHYQHYQLNGTTPYSAIRKGDFKLIEFLADKSVELYNLKDDVGEQHNLADEMPTKAKELRDRLYQWRKEVGAQMPTPNPAYDPSKPEHPPKASQTTKKTAAK